MRSAAALGTQLLYQQLSNYEGYKRVEVMRERLAEGDLKGRAPRAPTLDYLCWRCRERKRSTNLVRVRHGIVLVGSRRVRRMKGWYVDVCDDCLPHVAGAREQASTASLIDAQLREGDAAGFLREHGVTS